MSRENKLRARTPAALRASISAHAAAPNAQAAHLAQRTGGAAGAEGGTLAQRSALGGLVPEALLHMLASYGAGAFAAALVGDSDTPELIWTHRMRAQRLVPEVRLSWDPPTCPSVESSVAQHRASALQTLW